MLESKEPSGLDSLRFLTSSNERSTTGFRQIELKSHALAEPLNLNG